MVREEWLEKREDLEESSKEVGRKKVHFPKWTIGQDKMSV